MAESETGGLLRVAAPIATAILVLVVRALLRPRASQPVNRPPRLQEFDGEFVTTRWKVSASYAVLATCLGLGSWKLLSSLNVWIAELDGPASFRLLPSRAIWWFFPGFGSLTVGWVVLERVLPRLLGQDAAANYFYWTHVFSGFDCPKAMRGMAIFFALPALVFSLGSLPVHTSFLEEGVVFRRWSAPWAESYEYGRIQRVAIAGGYRDNYGDLERDPRIVIWFDDGVRWSSRDLLRDPETPNPALVGFLEKKTGVAVARVADETDAAPP